MGNKLKVKHHLDVDPNDPRNNVRAGKLPSLNDDPEAPLQEVEVVETVTDRVKRPDPLRGPSWAKEESLQDSTRLGADPNDARLYANAETGRSLNKDEPEAKVEE